MATLTELETKPFNSKVICALWVGDQRRTLREDTCELNLKDDVLAACDGEFVKVKVAHIVKGITQLEKGITWVFIHSWYDFRMYIDDFNKEIERLRNEKV